MAISFYTQDKHHKRALVGLLVSWTLCVGTVAYNFHDIKASLINSFGSDSQKSRLILEHAQNEFKILVFSFDKAINHSSTQHFVDALSSFHRLNQKLMILSVATGFAENHNFQKEVQKLAQKTFTHFIQPFNSQIKSLDARSNQGRQRSTIISFVSDYEDFQLIYQGPLRLGVIEEMKPKISGI